MLHDMHVNDEVFNLIKKGTKTVELRLYDVKRRSLMVGETIILENRKTGDKINVLIKALKRFPSFKELYDSYPDKIMLGYGEGVEAKPEDMEKYYSKEDILKYGVLAIEMENV